MEKGLSVLAKLVKGDIASLDASFEPNAVLRTPIVELTSSQQLFNLSKLLGRFGASADTAGQLLSLEATLEPYQGGAPDEQIHLSLRVALRPFASRYIAADLRSLTLLSKGQRFFVTISHAEAGEDGLPKIGSLDVVPELQQEGFQLPAETFLHSVVRFLLTESPLQSLILRLASLMEVPLQLMLLPLQLAALIPAKLFFQESRQIIHSPTETEATEPDETDRPKAESTNEDSFEASPAGGEPTPYPTPSTNNTPAESPSRATSPTITVRDGLSLQDALAKLFVTSDGHGSGSKTLTSTKRVAFMTDEPESARFTILERGQHDKASAVPPTSAAATSHPAVTDENAALVSKHVEKEKEAVKPKARKEKLKPARKAPPIPTHAAHRDTSRGNHRAPFQPVSNHANLSPYAAGYKPAARPSVPLFVPSRDLAGHPPFVPVPPYPVEQHPSFYVQPPAPSFAQHTYPGTSVLDFSASQQMYSPHQHQMNEFWQDPSAATWHAYPSPYATSHHHQAYGHDTPQYFAEPMLPSLPVWQQQPASSNYSTPVSYNPASPYRFPYPQLDLLMQHSAQASLPPPSPAAALFHAATPATGSNALPLGSSVHASNATTTNTHEFDLDTADNKRASFDAVRSTVEPVALLELPELPSSKTRRHSMIDLDSRPTFTPALPDESKAALPLPPEQTHAQETGALGWGDEVNEPSAQLADIPLASLWEPEVQAAESAKVNLPGNEWTTVESRKKQTFAEKARAAALREGNLSHGARTALAPITANYSFPSTPKAKSVSSTVEMSPPSIDHSGDSSGTFSSVSTWGDAVTQEEAQVSDTSGGGGGSGWDLDEVPPNVDSWSEPVRAPKPSYRKPPVVARPKGVEEHYTPIGYDENRPPKEKRFFAANKNTAPQNVRHWDKKPSPQSLPRRKEPEAAPAALEYAELKVGSADDWAKDSAAWTPTTSFIARRPRNEDVVEDRRRKGFSK